MKLARTVAASSLLAIGLVAHPARADVVASSLSSPVSASSAVYASFASSLSSPVSASSAVYASSASSLSSPVSASSASSLSSPASASSAVYASSPETKPDPLLAAGVGAVIELACFAVGAGMLGQSSADRGLARAGWLTIESGFVAAPVAAHGVVGEWGRGAAFGIVPLGSFVTTSIFFADSPDIIDHGSLNEQRVLWALFGLALASSGIGIADAALAARRAKTRAWHLVPSLTHQSAALFVGGTL